MPLPGGKANVSKKADSDNMQLRARRSGWNRAVEKESPRLPRQQPLSQRQRRRKPHTIGDPLRTHGSRRANDPKTSPNRRGRPWPTRGSSTLCHRLLRRIQPCLMLNQSVASLNNFSLLCYDGDRAMSAFPLMVIVMILRLRVLLNVRMMMMIRVARLRTTAMPAQVSILIVATLIKNVTAVIVNLALYTSGYADNGQVPCTMNREPWVADHGPLMCDRVCWTCFGLCH